MPPVCRCKRLHRSASGCRTSPLMDGQRLGRGCSRFSIPVRQHQRAPEHGAAETARGVEKVANAVRSNHPFRKAARPPRFATLARADEADKPQLVGAEARAGWLVIPDVPSGVFLEGSDDREKCCKRGLPVPSAELPDELVRDEAHMVAGIVSQSQRPAPKGPDDKPFRRLKFGQRGRPYRRPGMRELVAQDTLPWKQLHRCDRRKAIIAGGQTS